MILKNKNLFYDWCLLNHKEYLLDEYDDCNHKITKLTYSSGKKIWWKCPLGHRYEMVLNKRTIRDCGCPYCSGHRVLKGYNDLTTTHPILVKEWDYEKNNNKLPEDYSKGSISKVWWKCENGHSFLQSINSRTFMQTKCPYCSNQKLLKGYNDLETRFPEVAKEWDFEKNNNVKPRDVFPGTTKKYWWICPFGHHYQASPNKRTSGLGTFCPICDKEKKVSIPEKIIYYYVKKVFPSAKENYHPRWNSKKDIDVYIDSYNLGIEYDGEHWHKNTKKDIDKNELCKQNGIRLIRIRENGCPILNDYSYDYYFKSNKYDELIRTLEVALSDVLGMNIKFEDDLNQNISKVIEMTTYSFKGENVAELYPDKCKDWDYIKNGDLTPNMFTPGTPKKVWWKCDKGHSYIASIRDHCVLGHECPICLNRKAFIGINDFATTHKNLLHFWDYEKNDIKPSDVVAGSVKRVWWKCDKGHSFIKEVRTMARQQRCTICNKIGDKRLTSKKTICYDLNMNIVKEYESASQAARELNVNASGITACCCGKRKTAYGFIWKYEKKV